MRFVKFKFDMHCSDLNGYYFYWFLYGGVCSEARWMKLEKEQAGLLVIFICINCTVIGDGDDELSLPLRMVPG